MLEAINKQNVMYYLLQFTMVVVNMETLPDKCHYIINHLLSMCQKSRVEKVIVLTCLRVELDNPYFRYHKYFENNFNTDKGTFVRSLTRSCLFMFDMGKLRDNKIYSQTIQAP